MKSALAALVAAVVVLPLASAGAAPTSALTRVSQDKIVDGIALHQSEQQSQLAAAPGPSQTLVGVFQVGRIYDGGASAIGWSTSTNSGKSWKNGLVPLTAVAGGPSSGLGPIYRADDPVVAYNARYGKWLVVSRGLNGISGASQGLYLNTSADGSTWSAPSLLHAAGTGDAPDKPSVTCDNSASSGGYGNCYIAYTNTASAPANQLQFMRSTDNGATWSAPVAASDASVGTGSVALVQPTNPSAASGTCGRVVVSYAGSTTNISSIGSSDCGVTFGPRTSVATVATHTVAQGLRTSLLPSASMDKSGAIYLVWQTRSFRTAQTTLSAAANAGDTNIKVASVTGMVVGNTLTVDTGAAAQTVTIVTVGTSGAGGTGVTITPALTAAHASGTIVTLNGVASTSTAAPNDIALAVMPGPTDATPAPAFGAPGRIAIESDSGATTDTVDHFVPAIAADPNSNGKLALFYFFYPIAACNYVTGQPLDNSQGGPQCMPNEGYVSSTNGGSSWSAAQTLASMRSLAVIPRTNGGPDLGNVQGAAVSASGPLKGMAFGHFPVGINVNGIDESMYTPSHGLAIAGGS
jgi:hypothetical protein